jgi:hypothetical protein
MLTLIEVNRLNFAKTLVDQITFLALQQKKFQSLVNLYPGLLSLLRNQLQRY